MKINRHYKITYFLFLTIQKHNKNSANYLYAALYQYLSYTLDSVCCLSAIDQYSSYEMCVYKEMISACLHSQIQINIQNSSCEINKCFVVM